MADRRKAKRPVILQFQVTVRRQGYSECDAGPNIAACGHTPGRARNPISSPACENRGLSLMSARWVVASG